MFALLRTERDAPKRDGISYVLIPMHDPGVTVRPITQISGDAVRIHRLSFLSGKWVMSGSYATSEKPAITPTVTTTVTATKCQ